MDKVLRASDVMQPEVIMVSEADSLFKAWERFVSFKISGAPVVNDSGDLVGVISQTDLIRAVFIESLDSFPHNSYYVAAPFWEPEAVEGIEERLAALYVRDFMTRGVVSAEPNDEVSTLAVTMRSQHVHRVIITEGNKPVGIVTALDLLRVLERH